VSDNLVTKGSFFMMLQSVTRHIYSFK